MVNPSEELTNAWLQECMHYFTMSNIKAPKPRGGMGAEIDILAVKGSKKIWVEVTVSTRPRRGFKPDVLFRTTVNNYVNKFKKADKKKKAKELLGSKFERWLVYGRLPLKKKDQDRFPKAIARRGITPVYFGDIFAALMKLEHYRLDSARGYINLFKTFGDTK
jgi:hypothetical protein